MQENHEDQIAQDTTQKKSRQNIISEEGGKLNERYKLPQAYISPSLILMSAEDLTTLLQENLTLCELCPKALWTLQSEKNQKTLTCFCQAMHILSYTTHNPKIILNCDGQLQALAELEA